MNSIPCIDIGPLFVPDLNSQEFRAVLDQIELASLKFGFYNVSNHGIPTELVERLENTTRRFFSLPADIKNNCSRSQTNMRGYFDGEYTKNVRDLKQGFDWSGYDNHVDGKNVWPPNEDKFKETLLEYWHAMAHLSRVLLKAYCFLLGVPGDFLSKHFEPPHPSFARLNYYPQSPDLTQLGVNPHCDACFLTILKQDDNVSSLQVYQGDYSEALGDYHDPNWLTVPPVKGAFTINVGEALQVWSNDKFIAPQHRVLSNSVERFSVPFFWMPRYDTDIVPIVGSGGKARYRTLNWEEFRRKRNEGDYAKLEFKDQGRLPNWRI